MFVLILDEFSVRGLSEVLVLLPILGPPMWLNALLKMDKMNKGLFLK